MELITFEQLTTYAKELKASDAYKHALTLVPSINKALKSAFTEPSEHSCVVNLVKCLDRPYKLDIAKCVLNILRESGYSTMYETTVDAYGNKYCSELSVKLPLV